MGTRRRGELAEVTGEVPGEGDQKLQDKSVGHPLTDGGKQVPTTWMRRTPATPTTQTPPRTRRGTLSARDGADLRKDGLPAGKTYIGRGGNGLPRSRWCNPFKIGRDGSREEVLVKFRAMAEKKWDRVDLEKIRGELLLCHCGHGVACHGDILAELAEQTVEAEAPDVKMAEGIEDGLGVRPDPEPEEKTQEETAGQARWRGRGPPRQVQVMGKWKPFQDGGGLCSPGRWPPERRRLPEFLGQDIMDAALDLLRADVKLDLIKFALNMAAGKITESPFTDASQEALREKCVEILGLDKAVLVVAKGQCVHLRLVSELLKKFHDPDWEYVASLGEGAPLGFKEESPRNPILYDEKAKWNLDEDVGDGVAEKANYASVEDHRAEVEELFREEEELGWMAEITDDNAKEIFGDRLHVAALAVIEEGDKIRVVHDASNGVHVNHHIRLKDQVKYPSSGELERLLRDREERGVKSFALVGDFSKAHRRVKVHPRDWGLQACRLRPGHVWVNKVGTYGLAAAGYHWSRLAAAGVVRMGHYLVQAAWPLELLLYVDDLILIAEREREIVGAVTLIFVLCALGFPFKWRKFRGGFQVDWIGYHIDLDRRALGISPRRASWLTNWMSRQMENGKVDLKDFAAVLGRLSFSMGPLAYLRPFIAPMYAWSAAVGDRGCLPLPWSIRFLFCYIIREIENGGAMQKVIAVRRDLGEAFRSDAKAEGQEVTIGGWECADGRGPSRARWFHAKLTKDTAPWAFSRGEPFRAIAALELYGTLVAIMAFADGWPREARGMVRVTGTTDNRGNSFILPRLMSSKFPLVIVLTELAAQLRKRSLLLDLDWAPREQNELADGLTNGDFTPFDPELRVHVDIERAGWILLEDMAKVAADIHATIVAGRASRGGTDGRNRQDGRRRDGEGEDGAADGPWRGPWG